MRLKLTLLAGLAAFGVAGLALAQQQPAPQPVPATPGPVPSPAAPPAPEAEEAPPTVAPAPPPPPARVEAEKPVEAAKPKTEAEKPAEPLRRVRGHAAIIQALDKVTAETLRFEAPIGQPIRYKSIVITVRACEVSADDEDTPDSAAYLTIDSQPKPQAGRATPPSKQLFRGWMFASTPGVNPLEHPVYDAWLIACKTSGPAPAKR